jgi:hypothetical protein
MPSPPYFILPIAFLRQRLTVHVKHLPSSKTTALAPPSKNQILPPTIPITTHPSLPYSKILLTPRPCPCPAPPSQYLSSHPSSPPIFPLPLPLPIFLLPLLTLRTVLRVLVIVRLAAISTFARRGSAPLRVLSSGGGRARRCRG